MKKTAITFLLYQLLITTSYSQSDKILNGGMDKFRFMEGVWKGNGWVLNGDVKQFFTETETVAIKLSGTIIQIEAFGVAVNDKTNIINDALGVLLYNSVSEKYELHIYQPDGSKIIADAKLNTINEMEWISTISSSLKIKYTIKVDETKWFEAGFKSTDNGVTWKRSFEMTLLKRGKNKNER